MTAARSPSIEQPDYWWYRARADLLQEVLADFVGQPQRLLDVGSADGPSVTWLRTASMHVPLDLDPRGLKRGAVCGSALALPFDDETFDVVAAFDVLEHCEPETAALAEVRRVLTPGGRLLLSVPAYQWAWTRFDDQNHHYRRYTRGRAVRAVESAGLVVQRATYVFTSTFPMFVAERLVRKVRERGKAEPLGPCEAPQLPRVAPPVERMLMGLARLDARMLGSRDLPFGSSVVVAATRRD